MKSIVGDVIFTEGPVLCEVIAMREQEIIPTVKSVKLEDGRMRQAVSRICIHSLTDHLAREMILPYQL